MKRTIAALAAALALSIAPKPASAGTIYFLRETIYNPYSSYIIGGPYQDLQTCNYVLNSYPYQSGVSHSCEPRFVYP